MAETITIARPYAEALFRIAKETGTVAQWSERLEAMTQLLANPEVRAVVGLPQASVPQVVALFEAVCGSRVDATTTNFLTLLAENDRLTCLPEITQHYAAYRETEEGILAAEVFSAFALNEIQVRSILPKLEAHFEARLQPTVTLAPELIGGIKVAVGDRVLDLSVRGKLDAMATALNN